MLSKISCFLPMFTVIVLVKGLIDTGEELSFRNKMFESHAFKVQKKIVLHRLLEDK